MELVARGDVELGEDFVQVVLNGAPADEEPGADLGVGEPLAGEPGDLGLLGGQLATRLDGALARCLPSGLELASCPRGERLGAHRVEHVVGRAQVLARVDAPTFAAQPLAVEQMGPREFHADTRPVQVLDRLAVPLLGGSAPR